jgi:hypothetical protein
MKKIFLFLIALSVIAMPFAPVNAQSANITKADVISVAPMFSSVLSQLNGLLTSLKNEQYQQNIEINNFASIVKGASDKVSQIALMPTDTQDERNAAQAQIDNLVGVLQPIGPSLTSIANRRQTVSTALSGIVNTLQAISQIIVSAV